MTGVDYREYTCMRCWKKHYCKVTIAVNDECELDDFPIRCLMGYKKDGKDISEWYP